MVVEKTLIGKQENISKVVFSLCQAVENLHLSNHVFLQQYWKSRHKGKASCCRNKEGNSCFLKGRVSSSCTTQCYKITGCVICVLQRTQPDEHRQVQLIWLDFIAPASHKPCFSQCTLVESTLDILPLKLFKQAPFNPVLEKFKWTVMENC